jgi:hypothetical protein
MEALDLDLTDEDDLAEPELPIPLTLDTRSLPLRYSVLKAMGQSPLHAQHAMLRGGGEQTLARRLGSGAHAMLLGGGEVRISRSLAASSGTSSSRPTTTPQSRSRRTTTRRSRSSNKRMPASSSSARSSSIGRMPSRKRSRQTKSPAASCSRPRRYVSPASTGPGTVEHGGRRRMLAHSASWPSSRPRAVPSQLRSIVTRIG